MIQATPTHISVGPHPHITAMSEGTLPRQSREAGRWRQSKVAGSPGFYCDEMLQGLGRWLRAAGHDTAIARDGLADDDVIARSLREGRLLLTCDRALAQRKAVAHRAIMLPANGLEAAVQALGEALGIDWLHAPFSRCLLDNEPLAPASERARLSLPPNARALPGPLRSCPRCRRLYWPGSHVRRMTARLEAWQSAAAAEPTS